MGQDGTPVTLKSEKQVTLGGKSFTVRELPLRKVRELLKAVVDALPGKDFQEKLREADNANGTLVELINSAPDRIAGIFSHGIDGVTAEDVDGSTVTQIADALLAIVEVNGIATNLKKVMGLLGR